MVMRIFRLRFNLKAYFLAFVARVCVSVISACRAGSAPCLATPPPPRASEARAAARQHTRPATPPARSASVVA